MGRRDIGWHCGVCRMLSPSNLRIFVSSQPTDMRKSFDGLSCLCRDFLGQDPTSGQVFIFFNRRRDQVKALWWDTTGYAIWYKRLEAGCFHPNAHQGVISQVELSLILEGIEIKKARRFRRFHLRENIC